MHLAITFCHADTNKPDFSTDMSLRSYQKCRKFFVIFPNNLILVPSYMQKVMANNNCDYYTNFSKQQFQFLTTFWSLTMYDLFVPENVYEKEIAKLKSAPAKIDENKELNASRKKKEKERINNLMEKLIGK